MIGLAFLGCGNVTRMHSRTLRRFDGLARFYASRDSGRAAAFSQEFAGAGSFASYAEAIADPRVSVVLVGTPPESHLELTLAALAAGKHVILEKPPLLRASDFDAVEQAAARAGTRVMVAENYHYKPLALALRAALAAGDVGEPRIVQVSALKAQAGGGWRDADGALYEGGIHWVSFMANLGLPVLRVHGFRPGAREPERTMVVVFEYEGGAVGTLYHSWEIGGALKGLRHSAIYGSEGAITFESNGLLLAVRGRRRRLSVPDPRDLLGYRGMFEDFLGAVREGRDPAYSLDKARRDLSLVEEAYASANRYL